MEDLFFNFADHLSHIISPILGNQVKQYLRRRLRQNSNPEEYINIENEIKSIMTNYFENASDKDYLDMSANLYNSYVEYDDENFIKSVKMIVRIYSYYQELKLRKFFARWKIKTIKLRMLGKNNNYNCNYNYGYNNNNKKISSSSINNNMKENSKSLHRYKSAGSTKFSHRYDNKGYFNKY